ncbi:MAG: ABC transporter permease [Candidatus Binatia bacterium]
MHAALSFKLAYRHVRHSWSRLALSVLAIALGVALVVAIRLMNAAVLQAFLDTIDGVAGRAQLTVSAGEGLTFGEEIVPRVAAVPGVKVAVPLVRAVAFPDDGSGELLTVHGVDFTKEADVRVYHRGGTEEVVADLVEFLAQPKSVIVGKAFAERRGLGVGSALDLVTPRGVQRFVVRGLVEPEGLAQTLGGRIVVMDLPAAERAFTADGQVNQVDVVVAEGAAVAAVQEAVASVLPPGVKVAEPALRKDMTRRTIGGFQGMLTAFAFLAVVAGLVVCYSRLAAIFDARLWEAGLLRAVGLRQRVVFGEMLKESLVLGGVGTAVGIPLGFAIGRIGLRFVAAATAINFRVAVPEASRLGDGAALALGVATGITAAVVASVVPALRLARTPPIEALGLRGRDSSTVIASTARWAFGAALALSVCGLVAAQFAYEAALLGEITTVVLALLACVHARPIVQVGSVLLAPTWERVFGPKGRAAARGIRQQAGRVGLTVATIAVGVGAIVMFGVLGASFEHTLVKVLTARMRADLVITSALRSGGYLGAPFDDGLIADLRGTPGVAAIVGEQQRDIEYANDVILVNAYDPQCFVDVRVCDWILASGGRKDALPLVAAGDAVLVTSSFAKAHGTASGDVVEIDTPAGRHRFPVAGVTNGQPPSAVLMSRDVYRRLWNDSQVSGIHVAVTPNVSSTVVADEIRRRAGPQHRILVRSSSELIQFFADQARQAFSLLYLMDAVTLVLVMVAIGDALATGVIERTREFATLRAVGLSGQDLFHVILLEGATVGLLGLVLASVVGITLGLFWVHVQFPALAGWSLDFHLPVGFVLMATFGTLVLCVVGALAPARRVARMVITTGLRGE